MIALHFQVAASRALVALAAAWLTLTGTVFAQWQVADTQFDHDRGFYNTHFSVAITTATPGAAIRYTLDGSLPTTNSGTIYSGPIPVNGTTVLRAIAYKDGMLPTDVDTHTYLFIERVLQQPYSIPGWPNNSYSLGTGGSAIHDYQMDPIIVNDPAYTNDIRVGLREIPTISVVMPSNDFWAVNDGSAERLASVEVLYPDGSNEQVDCGLVGHSHIRLKRSYRLAFRREYGAGRFNSKLFKLAPENGETAADSYNRIMLRGGNNRAWSRGWNPDRTTYARDQWYRDSQVAMSGIGSRGNFAHLYVNGIYWGLYNPCERTDGSHSASYLGGDEADWFAVNHGGNQGGHPGRWNYVKNTLPGLDMTQAANYDTAAEYLDLPVYCDYLIVSWMTGMVDWPGNNWWGGNRNNPPTPFIYYGWDSEWSWDTKPPSPFASNDGAWVPADFKAGSTSTITLAALWRALRVNRDFMTLFADRVYRHCFNDGAVSDKQSRERWAALNNYIRNAVIAESAKWGDAASGGPRTRDNQWQAEVIRVDGVMNGNANRLLTALRAQGFFPSYDPPLFKDGGTPIGVPRLGVASGFQLTLENPDGSNQGDIFYTTDGTDPREAGGATAAPAINAGDLLAISINQTTTIKARVRRSAGDWSALHDTVFFVNQDRSGLRITEIMYNPAPATMATGRGILSIVGDAGSVNSGDYGRALVEFKNTLPVDLTRDDQIVITNAANPTNNGIYTISSVVYEGTEDSTRTKKVLLTRPLIDEPSSPATADLLYDGDRFEFVELKNTGTQTLNLSGITFTRGLPVSLPDNTQLPPGGFALLARQPWDFAARYPGVPVVAAFPGSSLDNAGEELELSFTTGQRFHVTAIVPETGQTRIQFTNLPVGLALPAGLRIHGAARPVNDGRYNILSISNNVIVIPDLLIAEGARAWAVFHQPLIRPGYNDRPPWPMAADGYGYSIVPTNANATANPDVATSWRASAGVNGSPGADDPATNAVPTILINEVLTHTDAPQRDTIELYNPTTQPVDLSGWLLTDDNDVPQKFAIPAGHTIPALGYLTLYEGHYVGTNLLFDANEFGSGFSLNSLGDEVYLFSPMLNYAHGFGFEAAANGVSFGRYLTSDGREHFPAQNSFTPDAANAGPRVGTVVISEIMYHPNDDDPNPANRDHEFIELLNLSAWPVPLYEPRHPTNTWKIGGIGFAFPATNVVLKPGGVILLVRDTTTPAAFRAKYGVPASVAIFSYSGSLDNDGEALTVERPDEPVQTGPNASQVGYIVVDKVRYNDAAPWPTTPDGAGPSLERIGTAAYGNDPINWRPSTAAGGTPGQVFAPSAPLVALSPNGFNLTTFEGQSPTNETFSVWNAGSGTLHYAIADDAVWLAAAPTAGSSTGAVDVVVHTVSFGSLGPGTHAAGITVASTNALNAPLTLPVVVNVISNVAPRITQLQVNANPVVVNQPVTFNSTVMDDAFPGRPLSLSWSAPVKPAGATVTFTPSAAVSDPQLTFTQVGSYTIQLIASDTQYEARISMAVNVVGNLPQIEEVRVLFSEDDEEEHQNGMMELAEDSAHPSSDLEMVQESDTQTVGIRFRSVTIPPGSVITHAEMQFTAKETGSTPTSLLLRGELNPHPPAFTTNAFDISSRPRTTAAVAWKDIPAWTAGESGPAQTTPDLTPVIQELINQTGWATDNSMVLIIEGSGKRNAWSFDGGGVNESPLLRVEYLVGVTSPDLDGDGLDDAWEIANFGSTSAPNGGPFEDYDGDRFVNLREFMAGTIPTNALSLLALTGVQGGGPGKVIVSWQSVDGKSYTLVSTTNLALPIWTSEAAGIPATAPLNVRTVNVQQAETYFRVQLE